MSEADADAPLPAPLRLTAPLLDAYLSYFETERTPFTIPGHKQRAARLDRGLGAVVDADTPLYGGLDEIKQTSGTLREAERLAAELWGAEYARFSTGGSTHANQAIILALGKPGDRVLVSRTCHRSALSGLVLAGLEPVWLAPSIDAATGVPTGVAVEELQRALVAEAGRAPPLVALLLTEPGYLGTLSDLAGLVATAHAAGLPVIVDAAWGGHFGFGPVVPPHCLTAGADALVTSVHKALPGYSAAALLLVRSPGSSSASTSPSAPRGRISVARVEQAFEALHTTSPAGAPLASIDGVRALLQARGPALVAALVTRVAELKASVEAAVLGDSRDGDAAAAAPSPAVSAPLRCRRRLFLDAADFAPGRFDPAKLVLRVGQLGPAASGVAIERALGAAGVRVEMADADTVVCLATLADGVVEFGRLAAALTAVLRPLAAAADPRPPATALSWAVRPVVGASLRVAFFADAEAVPAAAAAGRISADLIAPYPPGVAVVAPGEVLTPEVLAGLAAARAAGVRVAYATDSTLATYRAVAAAAAGVTAAEAAVS